MDVRFKPETESRLNELASKSGVSTDQLAEDAIAAYLAELSAIRETLDHRYKQFKDGSTKLIEGEAFFESLRQREDELLKSRHKK